VTRIARWALEAVLGAPKEGTGLVHDAQNAGLVLDCGLREWPTESGKKGELFAGLIDRAAGVEPGQPYLLAYDRWKSIIAGDTARFGTWKGRIAGRLYLGRGEPSLLEATVVLHAIYGVPYIPGDTLKGTALARARASAAQAVVAIARDGRARGPEGENKPATVADVFAALFGRGPGEDGDRGEAGCVVFHDAWWDPGSASPPLAPEVINVHHADYYLSEGRKPPTEFDSPVPNPQVAVRGEFLFAVEGPEPWAGFGLGLLKEALSSEGIGGRGNVGYGLFEHPE
jgi:CRISPR-associated protein Cmr6